MNKALTKSDFTIIRQQYNGTQADSKTNRVHGYIPAFKDIETSAVYLSRYSDGSIANLHLLDGLPDEVIVSRDKEHNIVAVKPSIISGFIKDGQFYTREQCSINNQEADELAM